MVDELLSFTVDIRACNSLVVLVVRLEAYIPVPCEVNRLRLWECIHIVLKRIPERLPYGLQIQA